MLNIGPQELLLILVVALLVVGPRRLPELGRSLGKGIRELRRAQDEVRRTIQVNLDEPPASARGGAGAKLPETGGEASAAGAGERPGPGSSEAPSEVSEVSKTLGRGLAELRRAREEIQRSFRVDVGGAPRRPSAPARERDSTSPQPPATEPDAKDPSAE